MDYSSHKLLECEGNELEENKLTTSYLKAAEIVELGLLEGIHWISLPCIKGVQQLE